MLLRHSLQTALHVGHAATAQAHEL